MNFVFTELSVMANVIFSIGGSKSAWKFDLISKTFNSFYFHFDLNLISVMVRFMQAHLFKSDEEKNNLQY